MLAFSGIRPVVMRRCQPSEAFVVCTPCVLRPTQMSNDGRNYFRYHCCSKYRLKRFISSLCGASFRICSHVAGFFLAGTSGIIAALAILRLYVAILFCQNSSKWHQYNGGNNRLLVNLGKLIELH